MTGGRLASAGVAYLNRAFGPFGLPGRFLATAGSERRVFLGAPDGVDAHVCEACGAVLLRGEARAGEWECPACGERVPDRFDTCWKCHCRRPAAG